MTTDEREQVARLTAERDELRMALEMIAGTRQCFDNLMSDKDIARVALKGKSDANQE